ncbi:MAG: aldo/keto reductase [Synergistaceae bacterium]|jgi:predicted aldo/keto reductase-like oxidoreductase|nr:aldo/keto reductase [Synergistaceae bacterium]
MQYTQLGNTGLRVSRSGFGALPIQRLSIEDAGDLLRRAFDGGINFFDTARAYSNSEEKVGLALGGVRDRFFLATKTQATTVEGFEADLAKSLILLKTDHVDIYQFHNPKEVPLRESPLYECMLKARAEGKIRFIGITNHRIDNALTAIRSGLYDTLQYPLSALSGEKELDMVAEGGRRGMGVIAMKALCGGLLTSADLSMSCLRPMTHVVPIWGFQRPAEVDEVLSLEETIGDLTGEMRARIERVRSELGKDFCRGCGYCQPCPKGIEIQNCARMPFLLRRAVWQNFTSPEGREKMERIETCINCGACKSRCPYELDCPSLLRAALADFRAFIAEKGLVA